MVQIILYVVLAGVAIFFYALTRPSRKKDNLDGMFQQKIEELLKKMEQEQAGIARSIHTKLSDLQARMDHLEEKSQQLDQYVQHLNKQSNHLNSLQSPDPTQVTEHLVDDHSFSPRHLQVVQLLKQGKDEREIARQTGVGIGEIELVQRLLQRSHGDVH